MKWKKKNFFYANNIKAFVVMDNNVFRGKKKKQMNEI